MILDYLLFSAIPPF